MKRTQIKSIIGTVVMLLFLMGCSDVLDETQRSSFTPEYFQTESGVMGGLTALYQHLRYMYGSGYFLNAYETGTDEYTYGWSADHNCKDMDLSGAGSLTPSSSRSDVTWNNTFGAINTASGIIENATAVGIDEALIAEAKFFRAFDYFLLVQTFGGVPLDLGAGELAFNTSTVRTSTRNTVPEVYTTCIFDDLTYAIENLPENSRETGTATKTLARLYLAKAYLTYGWWLENPNDIDTYPECDRTDPDGHDANWYFQQAYDVATTAIDNPGPFSLQETSYDVNVATNDRHSEMLLYADHTEGSEYYDGSSHTYNTGSSPGNFAAWFVTWNYTQIYSYAESSLTTSVSSVQREAAQDYGRPWSSMAPPIGVIEKTFADKTYDSRYDATFTTTFRANWNKNSNISSYSVLYNANGLPVYPGDVILRILDEEPATEITYPSGGGKSNVGAGVLPDRAEWVISPKGVSRYNWPLLWKIGTYRTDNGDGLGSPNGGITRPFPIAKFSELYLAAAEAAVKGATTTAGKSARELVNVLRARAGKWTYNHNEATAADLDYSTEMTDATPATIDIDYILAERSREFFGEGYRWLDLVRTQKWNEYADEFETCGTTAGDHIRATYTRTIEKYNYLRPIPSGQLDALEMTDAEKEAYQNPGYE